MHDHRSRFVQHILPVGWDITTHVILKLAAASPDVIAIDGW